MGEGLIVRRGGSGGKPEGLHVWKKNERPNRLPEGYTELDFIEFTGTQYLDAKYVPTANTEVRMDLQFTSTADYQMNGAITNSSSRRFHIAVGASGWHFGYKDSYNFVGTPDTERHIFSLNGNGICKVDAAQYSISANGSLPTANFCIGWGNGMTYYAKQRMYETQFLESGVLAGQLVPCENPSGELGAYDIIRNEFFAKLGTNELVGGNVIEDFVAFVVNDDETAYPDGGMQDGYWYEKVSEITGIDYGEVTLSSATAAITINHNLKVKPKYCLILPKGGGVTLKSGTTFGFMQYDSIANNSSGTALKVIKLTHTGSLSIQTEPSIGDFTSDENTVKFPSHGTSYKWGTGKYQWVVIA